MRRHSSSIAATVMRFNYYDRRCKGEMFGFPRVRAHVAERGEERSLGELLMEELYSFVGEGWEQEDDITLLTLRRSASLS
jgi:serine phosphatase RsbU (regulator of sigma subunit)